MICPFCNQENRPNAKICGYCGRALPLPPTLYQAPGSAMDRVGLSPKNVGIIGGILVALLLIFGVIYIIFLQGGNRQVSSPSPTPRGGRTATALAVGSPVSAQVGVISPAPAVPTLASTPVITAAVNRRFEIVKPARKVLNVNDLAANKLAPFFSNPGAVSGIIFSAAWSPDGKRVLLSYNWKSSDYDYGHVVSILNEDGTRVADIIRTGPTEMGVNAAYAYRDAIWSPDGTRIAIRYQYSGDYGIWLANADGTNSKRLQSSDIGDWPRYWSEDGRWLIGISSSDGGMYGESIDSGERAPFAKIKGIKMYDQRYFPWRVTDDPQCNVSGAWFDAGGAFWDCD